MVPRALERGGRAKQLAAGERVLVFDVGGGTTDIALIEVDADDGAGFTRTAVRRSTLLLGGDNLDLTLTPSWSSSAWSRAAARSSTRCSGMASCTRAGSRRRRCLADDGPPVAPIVVQSRGAKLIGGALRDEGHSREELDRVLLEGRFFPLVARDAPHRARPRGGLQEFGLPYAGRSGGHPPPRLSFLARSTARRASTRCGSTAAR